MTAKQKKTILTCRDMENFMIDYVEGDMSLLLRVRFRLHLTICRNCQKYLQSYRNAIALGKQLFEQPDEQAVGRVPDEIVDAILQATSKKS